MIVNVDKLAIQLTIQLSDNKSNKKRKNKKTYDDKDNNILKNVFEIVYGNKKIK